MPNNGKRLMSTSPSSEGSDIGTNKKQRRVCKESTTSSGDKHYRALLNRINDLEETMKNAFSRLTEEIISLRRVVTRKRQTLQGTQEGKLLPRVAITSMETLAELEDKLKDADAFNILMRDLLFLTGGTSAEYVRNCWRNVIADDVSKHFTWSGSKTKRAAKELIVAAAIKGAFQQKYPHEPLEVMDRRSKKYFQYSMDRFTKKQNITMKKYYKCSICLGVYVYVI